MKKTLTIISLLFALTGAGQRTDWNIDTLPGRPIYDTTPKYDTIPIVYLYSDTARTGFQIEPRKLTFWDFGYEVREEAGLIPVTSSENNMMLNWVMQYRHIGYLDRHKQPIRKTIVIWNVKEIQ